MQLEAWPQAQLLDPLDWQLSWVAMKHGVPWMLF